MKKSNKRLLMVGVTLLVVIGCIWLIIIPFMMNVQISKTVFRVHSDMLSISNAIEAYWNDHNTYPPSTLDSSKSIWPSLPDMSETIPTFMIYLPDNSATITTPINYITSYPSDPFNQHPNYNLRCTFAYYAPEGGRNGWAMFSPGPDLDFDFKWQAYRCAGPEDGAIDERIMPILINGIYDPTNGVRSNGDIVLFKQ